LHTFSPWFGALSKNILTCNGSRCFADLSHTNQKNVGTKLEKSANFET
jgi:hypothetical protein